jgi:hypothetical protein
MSTENQSKKDISKKKYIKEKYKSLPMNGDSHGGTGILDQFGSFAMGHCRTRTAIDFGQNITATQFATHGHLIHTGQGPSTSINAIS